MPCAILLASTGFRLTLGLAGMTDEGPLPSQASGAEKLLEASAQSRTAQGFPGFATETSWNGKPHLGPICIGTALIIFWFLLLAALIIFRLAASPVSNGNWVLSSNIAPVKLVE
jgi:hypothetical protein